MFTGIVEELGRVVSVTDLTGRARRLRVRGPVVTSDAGSGDSICVDGVCLTVVEPDAGEFSADVMAETLQRTTLGTIAVGDLVNLERAMPADGRFGGHVVSGHVDGVGRVLHRRDAEHWRVLTVAVPDGLMTYMAEKGSVTLSGVSLTIASVGSDSVSVSLIPTTLAHTTLGSLDTGDDVNIEVDMLARYVERVLAAR